MTNSGRTVLISPNGTIPSRSSSLRGVRLLVLRVLVGRTERWRRDRERAAGGAGGFSRVSAMARCDRHGPLDPVSDPGGVIVEIEPDGPVLVIDPRKPLVDDLDN